MKHYPIYRLLIGTVFSLNVLVLWSQNAPVNYLDVLDLKNGSRLTGTITGLEGDSVYAFKLVTGATLYIHSRTVKRMYQKAQGGPQLFKSYNFREKGWFGLVQLEFMDGQDVSNPLIPGFGLNMQWGYRLHRLYGISGGARYSQFNLQSVEKILAGYAEIRGYLLERQVSPFYAVAAGYGWSYVRSGNILDASGGFYWSPQIGLRLGAFRNTVATIGLGYQFQRATFNYNISQWDRRTLEKRIEFRRLTLSTGLLF